LLELMGLMNPWWHPPCWYSDLQNRCSSTFQINQFSVVVSERKLWESWGRQTGFNFVQRS
jgi:hypothetical protein